MLTCPKCKAEMKEGFALDRSHYGTPTVETWMEGKPEPSFWSGLKTKGKEQYAVTTYRCVQCGYLESYAREAAS